MRNYDEWLADVLRLLKPPKQLDEFEAEDALRQFEAGVEPAVAVCYIQTLRDGGDPFEAGEDDE